MYYFISLLLSATGLLLSNEPPTLEVRVDNIRRAEGCVRLAVFASATDFAERKDAVHIARIPLGQEREGVVFELPKLPAGRYAIAAYHDRNNNDKLDTNLLGIPSEPYAFGREPESKWREPAWEDVSIDYRPEMSSLRLSLQTWGDR